MREREFVDSVEKLESEIERVREAQSKYAGYTQEEVDKIFFEAAMAANKARITLAKAAVAETGMGVVEDKVIKNHYAAEYIYNAYKNTRTVGVIEEDKAYGIKKSSGAYGSDMCGDTHHESYFHCDIQDLIGAQDEERNNNQSAPEGKGMYDTGSEGGIGGCSQGGSA